MELTNFSYQFCLGIYASPRIQCSSHMVIFVMTDFISGIKLARNTVQSHSCKIGQVTTEYLYGYRNILLHVLEKVEEISCNKKIQHRDYIASETVLKYL